MMYKKSGKVWMSLGEPIPLLLFSGSEAREKERIQVDVKTEKKREGSRKT